MLTWNEFAWAGRRYSPIGGDRPYQALMRNTDFLRDLRADPDHVTDAQVQNCIIRDFLNKWNSRLNNQSPQSAAAIKASIGEILPWLSSLSALSIKAVNFEIDLTVNGGRCTVANAVKRCYEQLNECHNIGATITGKILHILNPELFVMWDKSIRAHFRRSNGIEESSEGYMAFLELMNQDAGAVQHSFSTATLTPVRQDIDTPEGYLSQQLNYNPAKTMAKYLDEFNWVTITKGIPVPPQ